jgi:hypothetical protein
MEFLKWLLMPGNFMPHRYCYLCDRGRQILHPISQSLIFSVRMPLLTTPFVSCAHEKMCNSA